MRREENVPAQQPAPEAHPRLPRADADAARPRRAGAPAPQGPQAADGLTPPAGGERLPRQARVRRGAEYLRAYRRGRRRSGRFLTLHYVPNEVGSPRVGVTISRKVGNSVVRHRVKRQLLEVYRRSPHRGALPPLDLVLHVRPEAADAPFAALRQDLGALLAGLAGASR